MVQLDKMPSTDKLRIAKGFGEVLDQVSRDTVRLKQSFYLRAITILAPFTECSVECLAMFEKSSTR